MVVRNLIRLGLFFAASIFAYSLFVVGMREEDYMKLLGGVMSLILVISVMISLYLDFKR